MKHQSISRNFWKWSEIETLIPVVISANLRDPRVSKKTFAARSFAYMGPKLWNNTPTTIREIATVDNFKSQLKVHLFNKYSVNNCKFVYY